jgi:ribosomal protein S18 acetylase RimI-like enzyme
MNFYSDRIRHDIMDHAPLETMIDQLQSFVSQYEYLVIKYCYGIIQPRYLSNLLNDSRIVVAFHCLDQEFDISNCPSLLIYRKYRMSHEIRYYVLLTCTKRGFRSNGYASRLLDGLVHRIREDMDPKVPGPSRILLSSVEDAVLFYEAYGFRWTRESIGTHPVLMEYEFYDPAKEYFMMELLVKDTDPTVKVPVATSAPNVPTDHLYDDENYAR